MLSFQRRISAWLRSHAPTCTKMPALSSGPERVVGPPPPPTPHQLLRHWREEGGGACNWFISYILWNTSLCFQHNYCCTFCCFPFAVFKKKKNKTQTLHSPLRTFLNALKLITRNSDLICSEYCNSGFGFFSFFPSQICKTLDMLLW